MKTALWPLQAAIYQRLTSDAAIGAIITGVFDGELPAGGEDEPQHMPYIVIGEDTAADDSTKTFHGEEITKTLHVWSDYKGRKEAVNIMDLMLQAITAAPLNLGNGFSSGFCNREMLEVFKDDVNYHGVMRLRFKISQGGG